MLKKITILVIFLFPVLCRASGIDEAYRALAEYDYFKAKKLFYHSLHKEPRSASYGLAVIFYRSDNPFSQADSAATYIALCRQAPLKDPARIFPSAQSIDSLCGLISDRGFALYMPEKKISLTEKFLNTFYFAVDAYRTAAYRQRDSLRFNQLRDLGSSDSMAYFLAHYPESIFYQEAYHTFELYVFKERVKELTQPYLESFIAHFSASSYRPQAEELLFQLVKATHQPSEVYNFIRRYSSALTSEQAWKYLYSISVTHYSEKELQAFLSAYPEYPYRQTVQNEISLSATVLMPLKSAQDKWGYIDTLGSWLIAPAYDDASGFSEGFAPVCMNDTCFYIDKQGRKASGATYAETSDYRHGVAVVKQKDNYFLINRTGQLISPPYDDINELSGNLYVVRQGKKYGAINRLGTTVIPMVYDKLGDFKRGFAYYVSSGKYGLIDTLNKAYAAQWDWISDVDTNDMAVVKRGNAFGLVKAPEQVILEPAYDYAKACAQPVFLVVKNKLYGFYDAAGQCFISYPAFDYDPQYEPSYYSNGRLFKHIENGDVSMADANGHVSIEAGKYDDVFFAKEDLVRILKNDKFGFTDRKLKVVIKPEYDQAADFENGRAIVIKKDLGLLLDKSGKPVFSCKDCEIAAFGNHYLVTINEQSGLIDANGIYLLQPVYSSIERLAHGLIVARSATGLFVLGERLKTLKRVGE